MLIWDEADFLAKCRNNTSSASKLVTMFLADATVLIERLRQTLSALENLPPHKSPSESFALLRQDLQTLKAMAANLSALLLHKATLECEEVAYDGQESTCKAKFAVLEREFNVLEQRLRMRLDSF